MICQAVLMLTNFRNKKYLFSYSNYNVLSKLGNDLVSHIDTGVHTSILMSTYRVLSHWSLVAKITPVPDN